MKAFVTLFACFCVFGSLQAQTEDSRQIELNNQLRQQMQTRSHKLQDARKFQEQVAKLPLGEHFKSGNQEYAMLTGYVFANPSGPFPTTAPQLETDWGWKLYKANDIELDKPKNQIFQSGKTLWFPAVRPLNSSLLLYATGRINISKTPVALVEKKAKELGYPVVRTFPDLQLSILEVPAGQDLLRALDQLRKQFTGSELDIAAQPNIHDGQAAPHGR